MKIDLHIHTNCSDGTDDWKTILQKAEAANLEVISITDHNTVDAYFQMEAPEKYFSGKIIKGIEPECFYSLEQSDIDDCTLMLKPKACRGRCIELLGYGIDIDKMHESLKGLYKSQDEIIKSQDEKFYGNLLKGGIKFSPNVYDSWDKSKHYYPAGHLHEDLKKYPENRKFIPDEESWNNSIQFYRNYASRSSSPFYVDESDLYPPAATIYKLIKQAGGLVFIPHPLLYGADSIPILESLVKEFQIDGIECFYNCFTQEQTEFLLNFCKQHNLLVSAGSDYHGSFRPHIKLGVEDARLKELTKWTKSHSANSRRG